MLTPDTVFDIGKVTNQLTATAVLLLADEGELRLDDPVSTYLDGLPGWADDVTVTNLIHHTSGLPDYVDLLTDQGFEPQDPTTQTQALEALGTTAELQFAPGSIFRHSNSDYLLLAEIVRAATGSTLPQVLAERVFEPLGLDMTMDPSAQLPDKAISYRKVLGGNYEVVDWTWTQVGDGGIQATPSELVRWADNFRTGDLGGSTLQYAQLADAPTTSLSASERFDTERYGAGFFIGIDGGLFDLGEWEGYTTALEITRGPAGRRSGGVQQRLAGAVGNGNHPHPDLVLVTVGMPPVSASAAVWAGDDLQEMPAGIFPIDTAPAVVRVELTRPALAGVGPIRQVSASDWSKISSNSVSPTRNA